MSNNDAIEVKGALSLSSSGNTKKYVIRVGESGDLPALSFDITNIKKAEDVLPMCKNVTFPTYSEIEHDLVDGFRHAKNLLSSVGYEINKTKSFIRKLKSQFLIDDYPAFLKEKGLKDNSHNREAFLERQEEYVEANDRLTQLLAIESLLETKAKTFEMASRYVKRQLEILLKSTINTNKY